MGTSAWVSCAYQEQPHTTHYLAWAASHAIVIIPCQLTLALSRHRVGRHLATLVKVPHRPADVLSHLLSWWLAIKSLIFA